MTRLERLKEYMSLAGCNVKKELKTIGNYHATEQYLGQVLNGSYPLTDLEEKEIYRAINVTRAKKLMNKGDKIEKKNDAVTSQQEKN